MNPTTEFMSDLFLYGSFIPLTFTFAMVFKAAAERENIRDEQTFQKQYGNRLHDEIAAMAASERLRMFRAGAALSLIVGLVMLALYRLINLV